MSSVRYYAGTYSYPVLWGDGSLYTGNGQGIAQLSFDEMSGKFTLDKVAQGVRNPSFITVNQARTRLYCVNELDEFNGLVGGAVSAYAIEGDGSLTLMAQAHTQGQSPCHVRLDPQESCLCVSNYNGGSLCVIPLDEKGSFAPGAQLFQHTYHGPHPRQEKAHVHSTLFTPNGQWALAADLGGDRLYAYPAQRGKLGAEPHITEAPGASGPRMLVWHPACQVYYGLCELSNTLLVYAADEQQRPGALVQAISTLPEGVTDSSAGDLVLSKDGACLYVSNRGHDSIATFRIDSQGLAALAGTVPCGGQTPRSIALSPSGQWLFACNQDSDTVGVFSVKEGLPVAHDIFKLPTPTCLCPA